ncbi:MAG: hypothetical protein ACJASR_002349, partial [Psychroserpens sp.]
MFSGFKLGHWYSKFEQTYLIMKNIKRIVLLVVMIV